MARRAFYPLTFPVTVGPGSISIAITLGAGMSTGFAPASLHALAGLIGVGVVALSVYLSYRFASLLIFVLGETGATAFLRLTAFILVCVGVGIMWGSLAELIRPLITPH